jgi:hypothetical protein
LQYGNGTVMTNEFRKDLRSLGIKDSNRVIGTRNSDPTVFKLASRHQFPGLDIQASKDAIACWFPLHQASILSAGEYRLAII